MPDVPNDLARSAQKALASESQADTAIVAVEQRSSQLIFEIANATADRGFLYAAGHAGLAETAMLGGSYEIAQMAKLNGQLVAPRLQVATRFASHVVFLATFLFRLCWLRAAVRPIQCGERPGYDLRP
ncbi:hypothetical protein J2S34_002253 [Nitrobacter winogradskyi]|uniref:Uncharacterized protein n=1 Tax=Nitrobacter winogradskyi TaxID=913 RepID=A0ACC6ALR1_NITWI|nr:hypothetical protein [Nitrobacter winogradskyi]